MKTRQSLREARCAGCGQLFDQVRSSQRYCRPSCRTRDDAADVRSLLDLEGVRSDREPSPAIDVAVRLERR